MARSKSDQAFDERIAKNSEERLTGMANRAKYIFP